MTHPRPTRIDIWHNILWSQYKGEVFSSLYKLADKDEFDIRFFQIAETEGHRAMLSGIDLSRHRYPFDLLFKGSYERSGLLKRLWAIARRTWKSDADLSILTGYERPEAWMQLLLIWLKGKKAAVFCDSTINDQKQRFVRGLFKRFFFTRIDGTFCYGMRSRDYLLHYGARSENIYHRCQAAALPLDYQPEKALAARLAKAAPIDAPRFLYVGRLSPEKGLDTLIVAFAKIRGQWPETSLIIVGNGDFRAALEQQAQSIGLGDSIQFTGSKSGPALLEEYAKATVFILPSTSEPWGLVVNEALSCGCPVIVSEKCGCLPELVIEGQTGFSHRAGSAEDLAAKMCAAIAQFSDVEKTAAECLDLISHYTPDRAAEQILAGCRAIRNDAHA